MFMFHEAQERGISVPVSHRSPGSDQSPLMGLMRLLGESPGFSLSQSQSAPSVPSHTLQDTSLNLFVFRHLTENFPSNRF